MNVGALDLLLLYLNTVRYLKPRQAFFNLIRRTSGRHRYVDASGIGCRTLFLSDPIQCQNKIDNESVCFLNHRRKLDNIDNWICSDAPKLWRYNLHYFDYLLDIGASDQVKDKLIDDWIANSQDLKEDAWEPYTLSLRIVNWIKYFILYKHNVLSAGLIDSLYQQAYVLFHSIEYHILANHFWKNGKALLFAGSWLSGGDAETWLQKGRRIILQEVEEQILDDGGHYEKSPMYHSIFVEDLLDIINLAQSNELGFLDAEMDYLRSSCLKSLRFLQKLQMPDSEIPLFNDAALGIAPHPNELFTYAERVIARQTGVRHGSNLFNKGKGLKITKLIGSSDGTSNGAGKTGASLDASGYYIIRDERSMCVIDCGSISPNYQPGHTHCDLLSYELVIDGARVVVDSGVYNYEDSQERNYCRSTRAHNTVEIDGREQTEIWGQFRVARRAKVISAKLSKFGEQIDRRYIFKGSYRPYWSGRDGIHHIREITYEKGQWLICDKINGKGSHEINNFIHLHPDVTIKSLADGYYLVIESKRIAKVAFSANGQVHIESGWYFPEFGIKKKNIVIRYFSRGTLPLEQCYQITAL